VIEIPEPVGNLTTKQLENFYRILITANEIKRTKLEDITHPEIASFITGTSAGLIGDKYPLSRENINALIDLVKLTNRLKRWSGGDKKVREILEERLKSLFDVCAIRSQSSKIVGRAIAEAVSEVATPEERYIPPEEEK